MDNMIQAITAANKYLRENDIANWIIFAITAIVWPATLIVLKHRKVDRVAGLQTRLFQDNINIGGVITPAVRIEFINNTQQTIYITDAWIKDCTKQFKVPALAGKNIGDNSYHLNFATMTWEGNVDFNKREVTIQTNGSNITSIAIESEIGQEFYSHNPNLFRKLFRRPKYFKLQYVVLVGQKRHAVSTIY
jgi:hypothetical protein